MEQKQTAEKALRAKIEGVEGLDDEVINNVLATSVSSDL